MTDHDLLESWARHLRGRRRNSRTIMSYRSDLQRLFAHCAGVAPEDIDREMVEDFLAAAVEQGLSPSTIERRRQSIRQFYRFMVRRRLVAANPAQHVALRRDVPTAVATDRQIASLLGACRPTVARSTADGSSFRSRRDAAIVMLLVTAGVRTTEIVALRVADVDLENGSLRLTGRSMRSRTIALLPVAVEALTAYAEARATHPDRDRSDEFFLGSRGALTPSGVRQMLARRCRAAGVESLAPSAFRRAFAEAQLRRGVPVDRLVIEGGWGSARTLRSLQRAAAVRNPSMPMR